ncbi:rhodanese-like domain-containing protein [Falsihalocynthiibacter arcticus]|uniref:Sulfurtransferase n=1 Tax=Falsihalocynthiibacter arcticus TaxID=1579316 RepID=A0A126V516_9RHOB|nr:rhodanese-like domain-containing protein [Falsihalocynthiibacter arcticus]AML53398.1 sulfurtransferase [Falsihalocynthiibacter arcticus]
MQLNRRTLLGFIAALPAATFAPITFAQNREVWSVSEAYEALQLDEILLLDIRSPQEWAETGVAQGAWPVSLHEEGFSERLMAARTLAQDRPVALICATGGRSGAVYKNLKAAGYENFIDVSEGMHGSSAGAGWINTGLPIVTIEEAQAALPDDLL